MENNSQILQLCRLCLDKDSVNIPIFEEPGDIRQIYLKISSCLPVKVSRDDRLPKKICDGCSHKLDLVYEFRNTSVSAEKQLLEWLDDTNLISETVAKSTQHSLETNTQQNRPSETQVKQEEIDPSDIQKEEDEDDDKNYLFEQSFQDSSAAPGPSATTDVAEEEEEEPPPPKRAKRTAAVKAAIAMDQSDDDDEDDLGEPLTKVEDESDESEGDDQEAPFVDVPSTSADDQPGPSGVGKEGEAPNAESENILEEILIAVVDDDETYDDALIALLRDGTCEIDNGISDDQIIETEKLHSMFDNEHFLETESENEDVQSTGRKVSTSKTTDQLKARTETGSSTICSICGKFVKEKSMARHLFQHGDKKCHICSSLFKSDAELEKHQELHLENEYPCDLCNLNFKTAIDFAFHNYEHVKSYNCPKCTFSTKARSSLVGHIKRHYGQYTHHCSICGKGFIGKALLASHEEIHLDIKRYECDLCDKKFTVKRYLDVHRQLNHKKELYGFEQYYNCNKCGRNFTFEKSLRRHLRVIHHIGEDRTVPCQICHKIIANNYNLKLHMRIHTGEKQYCCEVCGKAFAAYKYWKKHKLNHEKKALIEDFKLDFQNYDSL